MKIDQKRNEGDYSDLIFHSPNWIFLILIHPFAISLFFSTLYLRYHYFVDMIAGFLLAIIVFYFGPILNNWWEMKKNYYWQGL